MKQNEKIKQMPQILLNVHKLNGLEIHQKCLFQGLPKYTKIPNFGTQIPIPSGNPGANPTTFKFTATTSHCSRLERFYISKKIIFIIKSAMPVVAL
jgi:hypothetical protein